MHVKKFLPYVLTVIFEELSKQSGSQRKTLNNIEESDKNKDDHKEAEEEERQHHLYTTQILADCFNYCQALKVVGNWKEPHQLKEAMETIAKMRNILDPGAVWLICLCDIDALQQASNSSLLLCEKDDPDTDKLKNILHFGYGEASEKSKQLIADAMDQWMKSGDTSSSHTA
ncbi:hypothetical protein BD769DRAFT_1389810 [Suillus cothurnatus]|nr:hypothetical protein BD769DRAFT_1389810 [Suillus cothurnatus]